MGSLETPKQVRIPPNHEVITCNEKFADCIQQLAQRWKSGRVFRVGPGFGPNFPEKSGSIVGTLANNFFSFGRISQN